ncbi:MAG: hypothetical protein LBR29_01095 [Methylobacteriaceae bacterium]|nr:hypothetical protein [Methylobacteriaceae bacterium]
MPNSGETNTILVLKRRLLSEVVISWVSKRDGAEGQAACGGMYIPGTLFRVTKVIPARRLGYFRYVLIAEQTVERDKATDQSSPAATTTTSSSPAATSFSGGTVCCRGLQALDRWISRVQMGKDCGIFEQRFQFVDWN